MQTQYHIINEQTLPLLKHLPQIQEAKENLKKASNSDEAAIQINIICQYVMTLSRFEKVWARINSENKSIELFAIKKEPETVVTCAPGSFALNRVIYHIGNTLWEQLVFGVQHRTGKGGLGYAVNIKKQIQEQYWDVFKFRHYFRQQIYPNISANSVKLSWSKYFKNNYVRQMFQLKYKSQDNYCSSNASLPQKQMAKPMNLFEASCSHQFWPNKLCLLHLNGKIGGDPIQKSLYAKAKAGAHLFHFSNPYLFWYSKLSLSFIKGMKVPLSENFNIRTSQKVSDRFDELISLQTYLRWNWNHFLLEPLQRLDMYIYSYFKLWAGKTVEAGKLKMGAQYGLGITNNSKFTYELKLAGLDAEKGFAGKLGFTFNQ